MLLSHFVPYNDKTVWQIGFSRNYFPAVRMEERSGGTAHKYFHVQKKQSIFLDTTLTNNYNEHIVTINGGNYGNRTNRKRRMDESKRR